MVVDGECFFLDAGLVRRHLGEEIDRDGAISIASGYCSTSVSLIVTKEIGSNVWKKLTLKE